MPRPPLPVGSYGKIARTRLADRRWRASARFRDLDGVTRKVEASGASGAAAERALILALQQRRGAGGDGVTAEMKLSTLAELWLRTEVEGSERATNTQQRYAEVVRGYLVPRAGGLRVREATVPRLDRLTREISSEVGPATAKLARTCLAGIMGLAVRHGALPANPVREVAVPRQERGEVRALDVKQVIALRTDLAADAAAVSVQLPELVDVALGTGGRLGELLALRWTDVDLEAGTVALTGTVVRVRPAEGRPGGLVRQDTTKGHRPRRLLLPAFAVDALRRQEASQLPGGVHGLVFPSASATLREVHTVGKQWRAFRARHPRWSWVSPHTFRKTVGTHIDRQRGTTAAAAQLGHTSERITSTHYVERAQLGPDVREVLDAFGS